MIVSFKGLLFLIYYLFYVIFNINNKYIERHKPVNVQLTLFTK